MSVGGINEGINLLAPRTATNVETSRPPGANSASFADLLTEKLAEVNNLQKQADALVQGYVAGEVTDLHQVVLATERAQLALELTVQVRNKLIEAYQEVFRMQI